MGLEKFKGIVNAFSRKKRPIDKSLQDFIRKSSYTQESISPLELSKEIWQQMALRVKNGGHLNFSVSNIWNTSKGKGAFLKGEEPMLSNLFLRKQINGHV